VRKLAASLALIAACCFAFSGSSTAANQRQATPKPTGITISPASQQIVMSGAEAQHRLEFTITNNESKTQTINVTTADFNTLGESGGLAFVGTNPTQLQKKYGLATWLNIPENTVTLPPKHSTTISTFILNQPNMSPGGHYGALMLSLDNSNTSTKSRNNVALHAIASSLIFVNKTGGDTHILKLTDVLVGRSPFKLPNSVTLRFKNDGNTHLVPRGVITLTSPGGKLISKGIINENSNLVLPETYRRMSIPLNSVSAPLRPGGYTLRVDFRFDGYNQFRSYQSKIFLLTPSRLVIIVLALLFLIITGYFVVRNKQIKHRIGKAQKKLRKPHKK
jgi:hypothetical protein